MSLNQPRALPGSGPPAPSASVVAAAVLGSIALAVRRAQMVAAVHEVDGCPTPGRCAPCAAERRRQNTVELAEYHRHDAQARREAAEQHVISASRIAERTAGPNRVRRARRLAREAALIERTAELMPGARCRVCAMSADGARSCRACGAVATDETDSVNATLKAAGLAPQTSPHRHPGTWQSAPQGRGQSSVPPTHPAALALSQRRHGTAAGGPDDIGHPAPGTDPVAFAAALRTLDRCPGCGEHGTHGRVCEGCSCLG